MKCKTLLLQELMIWVINLNFIITLGRRIDDIEKSVTELMNDLGFSDDENEKGK